MNEWSIKNLTWKQTRLHLISFDVQKFLEGEQLVKVSDCGKL